MRASIKYLGNLLLGAAATAVLGAGPASAAALSPERLGVNVTTATVGGRLAPTDLALASTSGLGLMRAQVIAGSNSDQLVILAASAGLRLYPMLGLPAPMSPSDAAVAMSDYVTWFAERYGPGGSFWSENPHLPYLPVQRYEIGNEPNLPLYWVADSTNLHWSDPASYAEVYNSARDALHQVNPNLVAVVGGLADGGCCGIDVQGIENWLGALTPGAVDAFGLHLYTGSYSVMQTDTQALRQWMNANGFQNVPIDVNETGACNVTAHTAFNTACSPSISSEDWGAYAAAYTKWSLCNPGLDIGNVQVEYWGDIPGADMNAILPLVSAEGNLTSYGQEYLAETESLTTMGCPPVDVVRPVISGTLVSGKVLAADPGVWVPAATSPLSYSWARCDVNGQNCMDIPGATSAIYLLQGADVGATLVVSVTAVNSAGTSIDTSAPVGPITSASSGGGGGSGSGGSGSGSGGSGSGSGNKLGSGGSGSSAGGTSNNAGWAGGAIGSGSGNAPAGSKPAAAGVATVTNKGEAVLAPTRLRISDIWTRGLNVTITVRVLPATSEVTARAQDGSRHVALRLIRHSHGNAVLSFAGVLSKGRWIVTVVCEPVSGHAAPKPARRAVTFSA